MMMRSQSFAAPDSGSSPRRFKKRLIIKHKKVKTIDDLPKPILLKIFSFIDNYTLYKNVRFVSRRWSRVANDKALWTQLTFEENKIGLRTIFDLLQMAPKLQSLTLISVPNVNSILKKITSHNTNLRELTVKHSTEYIGDRIMKPLLQKCNKITKLDFKGTHFSSDNLHKEFQTLDLEKLSLSVNKKYLNGPRLLELMLNCGQIRELKLFHQEIGFPIITDDLAIMIMDNLSYTLKSLKIDCSFLSAKGYSVILKCKKLEKLDLRNAITYGSSQFRSTASALSLDSLKIENAYGLKNLDFLQLSNPEVVRLNFIETFSLTYCQQLEDSGLRTLLEIWRRSLKYICLEGCSSLTSRTIDVLKSTCINLQYLNVAFIPRIQNYCCRIIPLHLKHLKTFITDNTVNYDDLYTLHLNMPNLTVMISESKFFKSRKLITCKPVCG